MHRNENATGYLTRLQNYSHKAKQAGAHISAERFQKVLFSQMKKHPNPTYRNKAESLETRAQLDNQPIPNTVLEHIFFSLDGSRQGKPLTKTPILIKHTPKEILLDTKTNRKTINLKDLILPTKQQLPP